MEGGGAYYLPLRHTDGNLAYGPAMGYLIHQTQHFTGDVVGANLQYDLDFLQEACILFDPKKVIFRDIQIAESLLNEFRPSYALASLAVYYGMLPKDESLLTDVANLLGVDPKKGMSRLPAWAVANYAIRDVQLPLAIYREQEQRLHAEGLDETWAMECNLLPILLRMRRRGVAVNPRALDRIEVETNHTLARLAADISRETSYRFAAEGFQAPGAVKRILQHLGAPTASIDKEAIAAVNHPVARLLEEGRKWTTMKNVFIASIRKHEVNGRIHPSFRQCRASHSSLDAFESGAAFGRLSCTDPNLQQQPSHGAVGKMWREVYVPDNGLRWHSADYSAQEPRLYTHFAAVAGIAGADSFAQQWAANPRMDVHQAVADLCGITRGQAKIIGLGLAYGMGGAKLCQGLGLPTVQRSANGIVREVAGPEGTALIQQYNARFPFLRNLARLCTNAAERRGYVRILTGRKCRFKADDDGRRQQTHKALNRLIQGSAASQMKLAMIAADRAGVSLQLQVHDELCASGTDAQADTMRKCMEDAVKLRVPSVVDVASGMSWGECL
jgi:DNA polymerase I-like protein with 3'-5' exonuclease and polymerase domains